MADIDYDKLADANARAIKAAQSGGASLSTDVIDKIKQIAETAVPAAMGLTQLKTGADGATIAFNAVSSTVGMLNGKLSLGIGALGDTLLKSKADLDAAGNIGIGANNIGLLLRESRESGLSMQQFTELVKQSGTSLSGMAGIGWRSVDTFSKFTAGVQEGSESLYKMGWNAQNVADTSALFLANSTKLNMADEKAMRESLAATQEFALQIDAVSKVTNMSKEAIMGSVRAEEKKPATMLAMLQMDEQQRQNFQKTQVALSALGPSTQALASEILTGGVRTKEGVAMMAALGPAGTQLEAAIKQQHAAKTSEEKKAAEAAVEAAKMAVNQRVASAEYGRMVAQATGPVAETMGKVATENQALLASIGATKEANGDAAQAAKNQAEETRKLQEGQIKGADGKYVKDEGQEIARALGKANYNVMIQAGGAAKNLEVLNSKLGGSPKFMDGLNSSITALTGSTTKFADAQAQQAKALTEVTNALTGIKDTVLPGKGKESLPAGYDVNKPVKKETGSIGTVGKLIEDFGAGTPAILHGKEGVITEAQMKEIIQHSSNLGMSNVGSALSSKTETPTAKESETQRPPVQSAGNEEVMKEITTLLTQLNKNMGQLVSLQEITADSSLKQVKATKSLSGNRFAA